MPNVDCTMKHISRDRRVASSDLQTAPFSSQRPGLWYSLYAALCVALLAPGTAAGAPGDLDVSFNPSGSPAGTLIEGRLSQYIGGGVRIQADGKIVSLGSFQFSASGNSLRFGLHRHLIDGALDTTFGSAGVTDTALTPFNVDRAKDLAIQPNGKIVAAGHCQVNLPGPPQPTASDDFCLARYDSNGQLDASFGTNGIVITAIGPKDDRLSAIALQPDGKIIAAGYCASNADNALSVDQACVVRYLIDGSLDTSFGLSGKAVQSLSSAEIINAVALQENGKILIAGQCLNASTLVGCVARFNSNGTLDTTFSGNGIRFISFPQVTLLAQFVAVQPDGKIMVGGRCTAAGVGDFCLARLNPNGTLAPTLSGNGRLVAPIGAGQDYARAMAIQSDGRVLVSGYCDYNSHFTFCTARFLDNGELDLDFGVNGVVFTELLTAASTNNTAQAMALQQDGRFVVSGVCSDPTNPTLPTVRLCLARYLPGNNAAKNCSLDVDGDGRILATTDMLIISRASSGMPSSSLLNGIALASNATRINSTQIRDYLAGHCGMSIVP
jgi:uncharacterized delta-60 repeat protein